jgi:ankyrin repeat protein
MRRGIPALAAVLLMATVVFSANLPPIVEAAKTGNRDTLRALLQKGANANDADGDGSTALHWASYWNDLESVDLLLRAGAKVNAKTDLGVTPLWTASQNGSEAMVRRLLQAGADPNIALLAGETPIMVAARSGYAGVVEQLAAKGANVNARGTRGQTALMWAVSQKHSNVVKVLLAHKADLHLKSDTYTEMMAISPQSAPGNSRLIPHGADTALMFAARVGDLASAKLLLDAGANPNDADAWGVSATTLAAHSNFTEVALLLLEREADANADKAGMTALHNAIMHRNEKLVASLLAHGANPNTPLENWTPSRRSSNDLSYTRELVGATPLWLAARYVSPSIMKLLLERGADPLFVHRGEMYPETLNVAFQLRKYVTTPVMAALGMGGGETWAEVPAAEKEALTLEAVKLAAAPGVDLNTANTDGKTALDAAQTLKYESVIKFLTERGAKASAAPAAPGGRGGRGAAPAR